jgi:hypothetical protein
MSQNKNYTSLKSPLMKQQKPKKIAKKRKKQARNFPNPIDFLPLYGI